ncbi:hypothetical protein PSC71_08465 [Devosia sp. J2-20]|uniref:hypothetical protein n=1 Tax=Devosia sp. J2-20 TaxID=3026161 RepID=UPI00249B3C71|nr:hypothetical protein [Devosia sp. J2-20]WDR00767.1 hypothetical protein PSC71_08465 [Devosia sp. J2-20]
MSSSYRDDRPALIILGFLVGAIILVSLIGLYARHEANYQVGCYTSSDVNEQGVEQRSTICPDDFLYFGDGLAQWIMSLFAIVATGASLYGIRLLRDTFKETERTATAAIESNEIARDTAERQLRAYISVREVRVAVFGVGKNTRIEAVFVNTGQTPAKRIQLSLLTVGGSDPEKAFFRKGSFVTSDRMELGPGRPIQQLVLVLFHSARKLAQHLSTTNTS